MPPRKASRGASKTAATPKKRVAANGFKLPDPIPAGQIIQDMTKNIWVLGKSIGQGGFGEIYLASDDPNREVQDTDKFVVKVEPHNNGPLFTEMHCYLRIAKPDLIEAWMKEHKLKRFGMPKYLGSGSFDYNNQKYRFMVMERFGSDLQKILEQHNKKFSFKTVYQIGLEIIDVLEYIHDKGYIHADIKASNLLVGYQKGTENQVFLVDYGLACRYAIDGVHKEYKYDGRKAHDGTIEFTSRDAHIGAHSRRGDLEILGYNLAQWLCAKLPWEDNLTDCDYVAKHKRWYMDNVDKLMDKCFPDGSPPGLQEFLAYVASLTFDEKPDYEKCRNILRQGLVERGYKDDGKLVFMSATPKAISKKPKSRLNKVSSEQEVTPSSTESDSKGRRRRQVLNLSVDMFGEESDLEEEEDVVQKVATTPSGRKKRDVAVVSKRVAPRSRSGSRTPGSRGKSATGHAAVAPKRQLLKRPQVGAGQRRGATKEVVVVDGSDDDDFESIDSPTVDELEKENSSRRANSARDPVKKVERKAAVRASPRRNVPSKAPLVASAKTGVKRCHSVDSVASSVLDLPVGCENPTPAMMEIIARRNEKLAAKGKKK